MRQLKFRVWDMRDDYYRCPFGEIYDFQEMVNSERFDVQQFTGLLDKNGKEIYEGDILKNNRQWSFGLRSGSHFVVEFNVETGRYGLLLGGERLRDSWEDLAALTRKKSNECEVIGNIYEFPELLNNK